MRDSRSIYGIFLIGVILLLTVWIGINIVTDQLVTLAYTLGGTTLIVCALLGRRIWMILPAATALNITLQIPGQPNTLLIAQGLFCGFCVMLILLRRLPIKLKTNELHVWIVLVCICIGQAYIRNPVGLNIFGSESVGARPYALFGASLVTCLILSQLSIPSSDLRYFIRIHIGGGLLNFGVLALGFFVPQLGVWFGSANAHALNSGSYQQGEYGVDRASRIHFVRDISNNIALWISAFKSPIKACFHPIWAPLVILSFAFAAMSGFRNEIIAVGLTYLVGIAYRGGLPSVLIAFTTLIMGISLLAVVNLATPLPSNIQRSLSFLPGTWDDYHVKDAEESTQWRIDMWKEALLTDYWIKNKYLGDGLGITREELNYIKSFDIDRVGAAVGTGKLSRQQQLMMASGNYHSGPVSTIRTVGYFGLIILLLAQIRLAVHAHRQIKRARKTEWYPLTLLIGIPIIWNPIFFVFVYSTFASASTILLMGIALVCLLEKNLPIQKSEQLPLADQTPLPSNKLSRIGR